MPRVDAVIVEDKVLVGVPVELSVEPLRTLLIPLSSSSSGRTGGGPDDALTCEVESDCPGGVGVEELPVVWPAGVEELVCESKVACSGSGG